MPLIGAVDARFREFGWKLGPDDSVNDLVHRPGSMPLPRLGGRIAQFVTWRFHFKAIGDARAIRGIEANAIVRSTGQSGDQAVPVMPGSRKRGVEGKRGLVRGE